MDSVLRPRDIQARIRSGETPEAVAAVAQTTVEKIMVYATPVLAERAWVAQQAQKASVRRRAANGPIGQLGEAVAARLTVDDLDPESVEWDAWRREDGRWALVADYAAADETRRAAFVYDVAGRYVVAEDEEARRLVGEGSSRAGVPAADDVDAQTALGDDAIELVTGQRPAAVVPEPTPAPGGPAPRPAQRPAQRPTRPAPVRAEGTADPTADLTADLAAEATVDLTEAARAARTPRRSVPEEWMSTQASERPAPPAEEALFDAADVAGEPGAPSTRADIDGVGATPSHAPSEPASEAVAEQAASEAAAETAGDAADPDTGAAAAAAAAAGKGTPRKGPSGKGRSKGRASVPSWDEIMFGSGRGD